MNDKDVWEHIIDSPISIQSSSLAEGQRARIFVGLSVSEYDSLPGSHYWATEETSIGIFECKADVIMFYRTEQRIESVSNQIRMQKGK